MAADDLATQWIQDISNHVIELVIPGNMPV